MKNLLKYLIPVLMTVALSCVTSRYESSSQDTLSHALSSENQVFTKFFSLPDSALSVPRQISTGTNHLQSNVRRTANLHHRPIVEVVKSGKAHNVYVVYLVQRKSVIINTSIVEHSHKLVSLGKLII